LDAKPKPAPDPVIKCIKKMNLTKEECLIVGDSVNDIRAGKAADITTIAVLSGIYSYDELSNENPDLIIQSIFSLTAIFQ
jgi:phosphoglycolate phosphatase-like HAD superfamily hydrolase